MGNVLTIRFERFTVFKPPALPEVMTYKNVETNILVELISGMEFACEESRFPS